MAKRDKARPAAPELNTLQRVAAFMERTRLADYMDLMNKPWRLMWLNFLGGLARGVGIFIGGGIIGALGILILAKMLTETLSHLGGLPWVGTQLEAAIAWILAIIEQRKGPP